MGTRRREPVGVFTIRTVVGAPFIAAPEQWADHQVCGGGAAP